MTLYTVALVVIVGYLLGSFPSGYLITKWFRGQDIRQLGSGRTGSTNVMRAGGWKLGLLTGLLDAFKAALGVWLAQALLPGNHWAAIAAGLAAVVGHNYSLYLGFKGGAGGGPTIGAAGALWPGSLLVVVPAGALVWYGVGYASVATLSFSLVIMAVMAARWWLFQGPWQDVAFGAGTLGLCLWALRPNLRRLREGTERRHGWRARRPKGPASA